MITKKLPVRQTGSFLNQEDHSPGEWFPQKPMAIEDKKAPFAVEERCGLIAAPIQQREVIQVNDKNSQSQTKWNCKHHKYGRFLKVNYAVVSVLFSPSDREAGIQFVN